MVIEPTPDRFREAIELLGKEQQKLLKHRLSYRLDASEVVLREPLAEPSKRPIRGFYKIDHLQFFAFLNDNLAAADAQFMKLNEVKVYVSSNNDTGRAASLFTIKLLASNAAGRTITGEGFASGPRYSTLKVWNASKNPASIRSENLGYFAAFLRAVLNLEQQLVTGQANGGQTDK